VARRQFRLLDRARWGCDLRSGRLSPVSHRGPGIDTLASSQGETPVRRDALFGQTQYPGDLLHGSHGRAAGSLFPLGKRSRVHAKGACHLLFRKALVGSVKEEKLAERPGRVVRTIPEKGDDPGIHADLRFRSTVLPVPDGHRADPEDLARLSLSQSQVVSSCTDMIAETLQDWWGFRSGYVVSGTANTRLRPAQGQVIERLRRAICHALRQSFRPNFFAFFSLDEPWKVEDRGEKPAIALKGCF
jgi:hypothetical protein